MNIIGLNIDFEDVSIRMLSNNQVDTTFLSDPDPTLDTTALALARGQQLSLHFFYPDHTLDTTALALARGQQLSLHFLTRILHLILLHLH